jgi:hypothetical protein
MATRKQYIVSIGHRPVAVGCKTDAARLVSLLCKMDLIEHDYDHPDHHYSSPVYRHVPDEVRMRGVILTAVPRSPDVDVQDVPPRRIASTARRLEAGPRQLPQQRCLPGHGGSHE